MYVARMLKCYNYPCTAAVPWPGALRQPAAYLPRTRHGHAARGALSARIHRGFATRRGLRLLLSVLFAAFRRGFSGAKKYVRHILKYKAHISNYVRHIFRLLQCGRKVLKKSFHFPAPGKAARAGKNHGTCMARTAPLAVAKCPCPRLYAKVRFARCRSRLFI